MNVTMVEVNFFGDDRLASVEYHLDGDDIVIKSVKIGRNVYWNENGIPEPHYVEIDVMPVLHCWQVGDVADLVCASLKRTAAYENELLAA